MRMVLDTVEVSRAQWSTSRCMFGGNNLANIVFIQHENSVDPDQTSNPCHMMRMYPLTFYIVI